MTLELEIADWSYVIVVLLVRWFIVVAGGWSCSSRGNNSQNENEDLHMTMNVSFKVLMEWYGLY